MIGHSTASQQTSPLGRIPVRARRTRHDVDGGTERSHPILVAMISVVSVLPTGPTPAFDILIIQSAYADGGRILTHLVGRVYRLSSTHWFAISSIMAGATCDEGHVTSTRQLCPMGQTVTG